MYVGMYVCMYVGRYVCMYVFNVVMYVAGKKRHKFRI
jgi:hypothetical protein